MYEKVNPMHPDKIADRIAGALVDYVYTLTDNPKIAVEVLIGHGHCTIITETSENIPVNIVYNIVYRITKDDFIKIKYIENPQDKYLAKSQTKQIVCGDNGIFKGMPVTSEQKELTQIAKDIYNWFETDGKYIIKSDHYTKKLIVCQSYAIKEEIEGCINIDNYYQVVINPLGYWTGGINVDSGATNRKLGSDMGDSITGGGLHGKDLSKADVSVNIYAWLKAQLTGEEVELHCAIGDTKIDGYPYEDIVNIARTYIKFIGGFEKFAEWGLIR